MEYAFTLHGWDARKQSAVPVVAHLFGVCAIVQHDGGDEDEAIAALLHDALEDKPGQVTEEMLRGKYGDRVLAMVLAATDTPRGWDGTTKKPPWPERKKAYLAHVRTVDPTLLRPTIADKIDNVRAILADYERLGPGMFDGFNAGMEDQLWYYRECHQAYLATGALPRLVAVLGELVAKLPAVPVTDGRPQAAEPGA
jgi:GTP pyrophosphokinase